MRGRWRRRRREVEGEEQSNRWRAVTKALSPSLTEVKSDRGWREECEEGRESSVSLTSPLENIDDF